MQHNKCYLFVRICLFDILTRTGRRQGDKTLSTLDTLENFRVIPKSSIMKTVLLVLAITIVTIDCRKSLYDLRKREPWNPSEIIRLEKSIRDVWYLNTDLQKNYANEGLFRSKVELKHFTDVLYASRIDLKWVLAATCFEHFIADLLAFSSAVEKLLGILETNLIGRETKELMSFDSDEIYNVPTFLFHAGYRNLKPIFDTIHLLRTLSLPPTANLATDFILRKELQKFIREHSYIQSGEITTERKLDSTDIEGFANECKIIKSKLMTLSEIFYLNTTPLINTTVYDRNFEYDRITPLSMFKNYVYNTEKCTIYVSITNVLRVVCFDRDF